MYEVVLPLGFYTLYLTQNVRLTNKYKELSATVTAGRNQVGKFTRAYKYVLKIFFGYVKQYNRVWPNNMTFWNPDLLMHLHQNLTKQTVTRHSACFVSMQYVLYLHRNMDQINYFMARCIAVNHLMTRRYPAYWNSYYIQLGLVEYYAIMWKQCTSKRKAARIGEKASASLANDDREGTHAIMGMFTRNQDFYYRLKDSRSEYHSQSSSTISFTC